MVTVPAGTQLRMKFSLPSLVVDCLAEVVHEMPQFGMGVRFVELTPAAAASRSKRWSRPAEPGYSGRLSITRGSIATPLT